MNETPFRPTDATVDSNSAFTALPDATAPLAPLRDVLAEVRALAPAQRAPALWADQRQRWQRGERAPAEAYLALLADAADEALVLDLIYGEFSLRQDRGEAPTVDEYVSRFPPWGRSCGGKSPCTRRCRPPGRRSLPPRPRPRRLPAPGRPPSAVIR
jgi:hypothetical protein